MIVSKIDRRDEVFDIVRSICILWIVAGLHLTTYIDTSWISSIGWSLLLKLTYASLGTFAFISGYFLKNKTIVSYADLKKFYMSRFKRFWIPFFISCLSLWIIGAVVGKPWFVSPSNFVLSLFGISIFIGPLPSTLWFMVMMVFLYWITPVWLYKKSIISSIVKLIIAFMGLFLLFYFGALDVRVLMCCSMYLFGLVLPDEFSLLIKDHRFPIFVISAIIISTFIVIKESELYYPSMIFGYPFFLSLSKILSSSATLVKSGRFISYSSMNMYLFHRQLFLMALFLVNIKLFPHFHGATMPLWVAYFVVVVIIAFSYLLQRLYDSLLHRLT